MGVSTLPQTQFLAGMVMPWAGGAAPGGWLLCDGAAVSRTTYADLFAAIGTTYGTGDGTTTFNLPNLKGRVIVMQDTAQVEFDARGETGGAKTHVLTLTEAPGHSHTVNSHAHGTSSAVSVDHAHNVYARNQDTGTVSSWHTHSYDHWHSANWANIHWNATQTHGHHGRGTIGSEGPWEGANWASAVPVNVTGTGAGGTGNPSANHVHNFNHDHPSTNYATQSPWPGNTGSHTHTMAAEAPGTNSQGSGAAHNNLQPYLVMNYLIKT